MGYIAAVLRADGHEVLPLDLECWLQFEHLGAYYRYGQLVNREPELSQVEFFKRPDILIGALYAINEKEWFTSVTNEERVFVHNLATIIDGYVQRILLESPEVIMFSSYSGSLLFALMTAQKIKRQAPHIPLVMGGPGVFAVEVRDFVLKSRLIDVVVIGEGDETVAELMHSIDGPPPKGAARLIGEKVVYTPRSPMSLKNLLIPDFTGFPSPRLSFDLYRLRSHRYFPIIPISLSRGCIMQCAFCSEWRIWGKGARERPMDEVMFEHISQSKRYGIRNFFLCDSLLNTSPQRVDDFCDRLLQLEEPVLFHYAYLKPIGLNKESLEKLARAGFRRISYGVESGSEKLLHQMGKGTNVDEIKKIIIDSINAGIVVQVPFIIGFPGETQEELWISMEFFSRLYNELPKAKQKLLQIVSTKYRLTAGSRIHYYPEQFSIKLEPSSVSLPTNLGEAMESAQKLFIRWKNDVQLDERKLRWQIAESFLKPIVNFAGEEPSDKVLEIGKVIGDSLRLTDRFRLSDTVQSYWAHNLSESHRKSFVLFYSLIRNDLKRLEGEYADVFLWALSGNSLANILEQFASNFNIEAHMFETKIRTTLGCMIYQGLLAFDLAKN
ncbi:MAG TPA: radical SAM protein [candidate division Zixibacteria bacterium]|nr:radical SAM protein [candidate division Zixibacteria bacterium]